MLNLKHIIISALDDFKRNLLRTVLTALGIMIGVSSVVLLIAIGLGLKVFIKSQFEGLGTNIVIIMPGDLFSDQGFRPGQNAGGIEFDEKDLISVAKIEGIKYVAPVYIKTVSVTGNGNTEIADIYATNEQIFPLRNLNLVSGTYFTKADIDKRSKKVVLGPKIAEKLFLNPNFALTRKIKIDKLNFEVSGILENKGGGGLGGPDFDSFIYVPFKSVYSLNPNKKFSAINIKINDGKNISEIKDLIQNTLLKRYQDGGFSIVEQQEIQNAVTSIYGIINSVLIAIGGISLLVGGIGIMNIMYVSVIERYKEIGIRRALGATRLNILLQFITEAVLLSLAGGILGLVFSAIVISILRVYFPAYLNLTAVGIALITSSTIGIIFGVLPARYAAFLSPVEAIRYE